MHGGLGRGDHAARPMPLGLIPPVTSANRKARHVSGFDAFKRRESPWRSRYTWEVRQGLTHPRYTYDFHPNAEAAEFAASLMLRTRSLPGNACLALREVHVKGPEDAE